MFDVLGLASQNFGMPQDAHARAGEWLRRERERRRISVRKIAARFDVSTQAVNGWESGRYNFATDTRAEVLAELFGMDEIEVRRNLGLWVPKTTSASSQPTPDPDVATMTAEQMLDHITEQLITYHRRGRSDTTDEDAHQVLRGMRGKSA